MSAPRQRCAAAGLGAVLEQELAGLSARGERTDVPDFPVIWQSAYRRRSDAPDRVIHVDLAQKGAVEVDRVFACASRQASVLRVFHPGRLDG